MAVLLHGKHQLQWVNGTAGAIPAVLVGRWGRGGGAAAAGYRSQCLNTPLCLTVESRPAVRAPKYILLNYI